MTSYNTIILTRKKPLVMIVDDNPIQQKAIEIFVKKEGYDVLTAEDGNSCLELTKKFIPDVILLDVLMPEPDGFEVCKIMQTDETLKRIPIVFLSGLTDKDSINTGITIGGSDYLTKPIATKLLLSRLRTIIQSNKLQIETEHQALVNQAIVNNSCDLMVELDNEYMIQRANNAFDRTFSRHLREIKQSIFFSMINPSDYDVTLDEISKLDNSNSSIQLIFKDRFFDRNWSWTFSEAKDLDQNTRLICLGREIERNMQGTFYDRNVLELLTEHNRDIYSELLKINSPEFSSNEKEIKEYCINESLTMDIIAQIAQNKLVVKKEEFNLNIAINNCMHQHINKDSTEYIHLNKSEQGIIIKHDRRLIETLMRILMKSIREKSVLDSIQYKTQETAADHQVIVQIPNQCLTIDQCASFITKSNASSIYEQLFHTLLPLLNAKLKYISTHNYISEFSILLKKEA